MKVIMAALFFDSISDGVVCAIVISHILWERSVPKRAVFYTYLGVWWQC